MARACIFCGSRENLNRDDLWPKWLVETVTQDRPSEIERIFGSDSTAHVYGGKWGKGRGVCEQCNGGWMSNLESKIKPILEPLIFDSSSVLDYVQQSAIAIWTLKTAMAFECIKGAASTPATANEVFYSAADRQHLMPTSQQCFLLPHLRKPDLGTNSGWRNGEQLDYRTGAFVQSRVLCGGHQQLSVVQLRLTCNLLESASSGRDNVPSCATQ
jgi:hypothetical protein